MSELTVVLVHGAFAESSSWSGVITRLRAAGHPVVAATNELRSVSGDADSVSAVLASIDGPVLLAGHSYGGQVIANAARGHANVRGLVFVAAFAPHEGESIGELSGRFPGSTLGDTLRPVTRAEGSVDLYIRQDAFHQQFCHDVPAEQAEIMAVTQRPLRDVALNEGSGTPVELPSWFVIPGEDRNIPVEAQRWMAARAGAKAVVEIPGASHAVTVSHPAEVAETILTAAAALS